jgi:hypothetical protein
MCVCVRVFAYDTIHFKDFLFINSNLMIWTGTNLNVSPNNVKFHIPLDQISLNS